MHILALILSLLTLLYVLVSSPLSGLGRFVAPDAAATVMLLAIFGIRPMFEDRFKTEAWYGAYTPTEEGELIALYVGMFAFAGLAVGVFLAKVRPKKRELMLARPAFDPEKSFTFSAKQVLILTVLSTAGYIGLLVVLAGPGIIRLMSGGRSADFQIGGVPEIVMMIPMVGPVAAGLFLIVNRGRPLERPELVLILASIAISAVLLAQLGNRRFIIPAILIPVSTALIRKSVRVKLWHIGLGAVAMMFIAIVPMVRAAGARRAGENLLTASFRYFQEEGFSGVIRPIFVSFDTEMFDYIAIASRSFKDGSFGYGRGTFVEFLLRPVPSGIIDGTQWSDAVMARLFGGGCGQPVCPVAALPGVLYFDGGMAAVFLGSVAAGAGLRFLTNRWVFNTNLSTFQILAVAIVSSFALVAVRTNTIHALWWALYTVILSFAVYMWVKKPRQQRKLSASQKRLSS